MVPAGWRRDQRASTTSEVRPGNGAAGDEDRSAERTGLDGARPDAPLARSLQPAIEAARRVHVQRARPLAVADERAGEPPLGRRLEQHDLLAGQAVRDAGAAPGRRGSGRRRRRPGPPPRRPATPRARPRPGRARPSPSPRRRGERRQLGRRRLRQSRRARPRTPGGRRAAGRRTATRAAMARPRAVALPSEIAKACSCQSCRDDSAPSRRARSAARRSGSSACQVRRAQHASLEQQVRRLADRTRTRAARTAGGRARCR